MVEKVHRVKIPYDPHKPQQGFHKANERFRILIWGRRTGKDRGTVMETIKLLSKMLGEDRPKSLVPRVHWWMVAPTFPLARQTWNELLAFTPPQMIKRIDKGDLFIEFHNGGLLEMKSADNPDNLVGVGLDGVSITEAARVKEAAWQENIRPTLSSPLRGPGCSGKGIAILNSTPKGRNWVWTLYVRGCPYLDERGYPVPSVEKGGVSPNPEYSPDYWSSHARSNENPHLDPDEWEAAKRDLPELVFQQEYEALFLHDAAGVFRNIEKCATGRFQDKPEPGAGYVMGLDLARLQDFTVITIMRRDTREVVHWERFNQLEWKYQLDRVKWGTIHYGVEEIIFDATGMGGDVIGEALSDNLGGICTVTPYKHTQDTKEALVQTLQLALENDNIKYPNIEALITELRAFEYEYTKTGRFRYNAAPGFHDDAVISLGLAVLGCDSEVYESNEYSLFG